MGRTQRAGIATAISVLALAGTAVSAWAGQTSFGADLGAVANDPASCGEGFLPKLSPSPSCTWFSAAPGASFYAPVSGTVTAVRVKAGAVGGAMQVIVMRSLYQNKAGDPEHPYYTCCFVEAYGPVFEAKAGAVTSVAGALPMTEQPTPPLNDFTTQAAGDFLAISVLTPSAQIPAFIDEKSRDAGFYPSPTPQSLPAPSAGPLTASASPEGAEMLMNADLEFSADAAASGAGGALPPIGGARAALPVNRFALARRPAAALALVRTAIVVRGPIAAIPLQCLASDCAGSLSLQSSRVAATSSAKHRRRHAKTISYGTAHFSLKAGAAGKVKVKLSAAARRLLTRRGRLSVWANIRFSVGGVAPSSVRIALRR